MGKQALEIKLFSEGITSSISLRDTKDEAAQFSLNIEPVTEAGTLQSVGTDTKLYPMSQDATFIHIDKMEMLDLGATEDIFFHAPQHTPNHKEQDQYGLNFISDWYNDRELGGTYFPTKCSSVPCFAKKNKELHIGFGSNPTDSYPKWMGYTKNRQFGERVASEVLVEPANLISPDLGNGVFALDKIVRINFNVTSALWARPNEQNSTYTHSTAEMHIERYKEDIGSDSWLYGCKRGESYIYKIKTEDRTNGPMEATGLLTSEQMTTKTKGDIVRSNNLVDSQGKEFKINSIATSHRWPHCVWATSAEPGDLRVALVNVNDYENIHDPTGQLASGMSETWNFKGDCKILGEWALNAGINQTEDGESITEVPDGDWEVSDVLETFECDPDESNPDTGEDGNGLIYEGASGKILTHRLWITLFKEEGFENKQMGPGIMIEPFVYSASLNQVAFDEYGGTLALDNQTIPLRRTKRKTLLWNGTARKIYRVPELWDFLIHQGPNPFFGSNSSGYDAVKHVNGAEIDADTYDTTQGIPMGWNIGFAGGGAVVKVCRYPMGWTYGRAGWHAKYGDGLGVFDDYTYKDYDADIHQVALLLHTDSEWVRDGGGLASKGVGGIQGKAWCPSHAAQLIDLNNFVMVTGSKHLDNGISTYYRPDYSHNWVGQGGEQSQSHMHANDDWTYHTEALSSKYNKSLHPLSAQLSALDYNNIKSVVTVYNSKNNMGQGTPPSEGEILMFASVGEDTSDTELQTNTKIYPLKIEWQDSAEDGILGETFEFYLPDSDGANLHTPILELEQVGRATMFACDESILPMASVDKPNTLNDNSICFFLGSSMGEYANGWTFGCSDIAQTNPQWWHTVPLNTSGTVDGTAGLQYDMGGNPYPDQPFARLREDDATLLFDNTDETADSTPAFEDGVTYEYKMSFLYDGYQSSPLTMSTWANLIDSASGNTGCDNVTVEINLPENLPKRVSHLLLWRRNDVDDNFKLVSQSSLADGWSYDEEYESYKKYILDKGSGQVGESFTARTNLPEVMDDMNIKYTLSTVVHGYHVVGNCYHWAQKDMQFFLLRSELNRFDMFNWFNNWLMLPNVPTALASYGGKIYAFDRHNTYTIDPAGFVIIDTFEGIGCSGPEAVMVTEYGMCFADMNNIYLHDGRRPIPIGAPILTAKEPFFGLDNFNLADNCKISFDQMRGSFIIYTSRGKSGLYTEGGEIRYANLNNVPYMGYYHQDSDGNPFSGAYRTIESVKLEFIPEAELTSETS